jgi:hypothetical protein
MIDLIRAIICDMTHRKHHHVHFSPFNVRFNCSLCGRWWKIKLNSNMGIWK